MKAMVHDVYGPPDVLELRDVERPGVGDDEVFGTCDGTFAEYARVHGDRCEPKPARLSFEEVAAVPVSGMTARQGLRDGGRVQPGQHVLILGAGGGVGTFAVQLAKSFGRRSPACAARGGRMSSARSAPTMSSATPVRTRSTGRGATT